MTSKPKKRPTVKDLSLKLRRCEAQISDLYELVDGMMKTIEDRHGSISALVMAIAGKYAPPPTIH